MGRILAISGLVGGDCAPFDRRAVTLSGRERAHVLFIGTAGGDREKSFLGVAARFAALGCETRALTLLRREYTEEELDALLAWADVIYVGGGDTVSMMRVWRERGLAERLIKIYREDRAVLAGKSAGAICWFDCGHSDANSFHTAGAWSYCFAEGMLGLIPAVYCPHYNDPGRDSFDEMLREKSGLPGIALENGLALEESGTGFRIVSAHRGARAFLLQYTDGVLSKRELTTEPIS